MALLYLQHRIGTRFFLVNCSGGPVTIRGASGVSVGGINGKNTLANKGDFCWLQTYGANSWSIFGNQLVAP